MKSMSTTALAKKMEISTSTLRNWERHFAAFLSNDYKDGKNFSAAGVQQFMAIKYLVHERGFTLDGALKEMERRENLDGQQVEIVDKLQQLRSFLVDLKSQLDN